MHIGERLKKERVRLGLNQSEFAEIAGVSVRSQIDWEKSNSFPNAKALAAFAEKKADVQYILTGKPSVNWPPTEPDPLDNELDKALLDRIKAVMANEQIETHHLAMEIGEKTPYLRKVMDGALPLSALTLAKLVLHKEIDANWLLRVQDESIRVEPVRFYNPLEPSYLTDEEKKQLDASRQNLKPRQISLLKLFDTLSERQQQDILSITEEKERLNRLDSLMTEYMKTINKGD